MSDDQIHHSSMTMLEAIMLMAETWAAARSKDPNTKVGAVIYDYSTGSMHFGYNGFPKGVDDLVTRWERPTKYEYVIHAEENAILKALQGHADISSSALFVTHKPCHKCMRLVAQVGIKQVYYKHPHDDSKITDTIANEAGISLMVMP